MPALKILLADDETISRRLLRAALDKSGHELVEASTGDEAWRLLQCRDIDLAILDWVMPGMDGIEICRLLRAELDIAYVYVIVVTARDAKEDLVNALDAGADDYVSKPFTPEALSARVRTGSRFVALQRALRDTQEELRTLATRDELTGLWSRAAVLRLLEGEIDRGRREETPLSVAMIDLDHFKQINDRLGHQAGDVVLAEVASRLQAVCRSYDQVGRYGGEEMIALLPGAAVEHATAASDRLRWKVGSAEIKTPRGPARVTVSVGCASTSQLPKATSTELVRAADRALYASKAAGRDRVTAAQLEDFAEEPGTAHGQ